MRLTPLDIRKQEFSHRFRGYDADEVNAFLQMVANQWEELQDENRRREERIRELEGKLVHYEKVEEALQEALQTARESSRKALQNAEEKAEMMIEKAEARAEEIKREAERERHDLKRETVKLSGRRSEIVTRLRAFLMSEMELLARYEGDDPVGFIKLLPAEERRLRQLSERLGDEEGGEDRSGSEAADVSETEAGNHGAEPQPFEGLEDDAEAQVEDERHTFDQGEQDKRGGEDAEPRVGPDERPAFKTAPEPESFWAPEPSGTGAEAASKTEGEPEGSYSPDREDVTEGPGWTARTVVSRPSEQRQRPAHAPDGEEDEEETDMQASSEEIEKIRRILSDLD